MSNPQTLEYPKNASRAEWLNARKEPLAKDKELTRHRGTRGSGTYRKNWEEWFPTFRESIGYEIRDLSIAANEDLAFCHSFNRITGTRTDDEKTDVWVRATVCCRKLDGQWKIVHEHQSVPFYMDGSYRAAVDLKP